MGSVFIMHANTYRLFTVKQLLILNTKIEQGPEVPKFKKDTWNLISRINTIISTYQGTTPSRSFFVQLEDPMMYNLGRQNLAQGYYMTLTLPSHHYHMMPSSLTNPTNH
jgi:hypothetical protein